MLADVSFVAAECASIPSCVGIRVAASPKQSMRCELLQEIAGKAMA
jgi:hypothetical protein